MGVLLDKRGAESVYKAKTPKCKLHLVRFFSLCHKGNTG